MILMDKKYLKILFKSISFLKGVENAEGQSNLH